MKSLPSEVSPYSRTREFDEITVPAKLTGVHRTKAGVWGRIQIVEGELLYRILEPEIEELLLDSEQCGVVEPEVPHQVEPRGSVRFFVEFLR